VGVADEEEPSGSNGRTGKPGDAGSKGKVVST
jgi:hypothetical protein